MSEIAIALPIKETMETYKQALSIRQPWAWLIANGYKDIENRSWPTNFRGQFFIHASKGMTKREYEECSDFLYAIDPAVIIPHKKELSYGGIIGAATLAACVTDSKSPWFTGKFGFALEEPRVLPFMPCMGLWDSSIQAINQCDRNFTRVKLRSRFFVR